MIAPAPLPPHPLLASQLYTLTSTGLLICFEAVLSHPHMALNQPLLASQL